MEGILFVSSHNTGYGHVSITASLREQLAKLDSSVPVNEVDGFMLGNILTKASSKLYNKVAVHTPFIWHIGYNMGSIFAPVLNFFARTSIRNKLLKLIDELHPGLIVSVHPGFVGSVIDILDSAGLKIPVAVLVADLDNVTGLWADKRSLYTICPTGNSMRTMVKFGIPAERIKVFGFPTRDKFNHYIPREGSSPADDIMKKESLTFLIMNGSQGTSYVTSIAETLLKNFNCHVIVLAGNSKPFKSSLENALLPKYPDKVTICGFTENVEHYMSMADILIVRASPNVLTEAVNLCKPIIVTGAFAGQEEKNPDFVADNNLGVVCRDFDTLPDAVKGLLADDGKRLKEIYGHQLKYRKPDSARDIARFLLDILNGHDN